MLKKIVKKYLLSYCGDKFVFPEIANAGFVKFSSGQVTNSFEHV